jgi:hypothetical protein
VDLSGLQGLLAGIPQPWGMIAALALGVFAQWYRKRNPVPGPNPNPNPVPGPAPVPNPSGRPILDWLLAQIMNRIAPPQSVQSVPTGDIDPERAVAILKALDGK